MSAGSLSSDAKPLLEAVGATVYERGWLSANNILLMGDGPSALVDSGYATHSEQTVALVRAALAHCPLDVLLNTHLHSDHCGGNAALQRAYPSVETMVPPGLADAVTQWDTEALTYQPTGQVCPRFTWQSLLQPGTEVRLGPCRWQVHAAKGHDPHSIVLFQPEQGVLLSADALWEHGFGVVFPELDGVDAFDEVAQTLDLIETLAPRLVIPGHGAVFTGVSVALTRARSRLEAFVANPSRHLRHAHKVLIKFHLLERQRVSRNELLQWVRETPYLRHSCPAADPLGQQLWLDELLLELQHAGALKQDAGHIQNL